MNDDKARDAVAQTGRDIRNAAAQSGRSMTQTEAQARAARAREIGDRKRDNNNR